MFTPERKSPAGSFRTDCHGHMGSLPSLSSRQSADEPPSAIIYRGYQNHSINGVATPSTSSEPNNNALDLARFACKRFYVRDHRSVAKHCIQKLLSPYEQTGTEVLFPSTRPPTKAVRTSRSFIAVPNNLCPEDILRLQKR